MKKSARVSLSLVATVAASLLGGCDKPRERSWNTENSGPSVMERVDGQSTYAGDGGTSSSARSGTRYYGSGYHPMLIPIHGASPGGGASGVSGAKSGARGSGSASAGSISRGGFGGSAHSSAAS